MTIYYILDGKHPTHCWFGENATLGDMLSIATARSYWIVPGTLE